MGEDVPGLKATFITKPVPVKVEDKLVRAGCWPVECAIKWRSWDVDQEWILCGG